VGGAAFLDAVAAIVKKYVVLTDAEAHAVALWCVATHSFDSFFIFPRLTLRSATPRCGKTTLRDVVAGLVPKPLSTDNILAAV
jgi:putative DNA primase/helicase